MGEVQITHQEIISLCRLCLAKDLASVDIFEGGNELRHLYTKIVACLPVQVFSSDTLPHKICEVCNAKVDDFYQFWTSTAKNQKQLHEWLQIASDEKVEHVAGARIKVEVEDNNAEFDDYDDGTRVDDSEYEDEDEPSAPKRIKTTHSDDEEDRKPTDLVGSMPESSDASGKKKTKDHKYAYDYSLMGVMSKEDWDTLVRTNSQTCPVCNNHLSSAIGMRRHVIAVHSNGSYPCHECPKIFTSKDKLYYHLKSKRKDRLMHVNKEEWTKLECHFCGALKTNKTLMRDHINSTHLGLKLYDCELCGTSLSSKKGLKRHQEIHKKGILKRRVLEIEDHEIEDFTPSQYRQLVEDKVRICPKCGKEFSAPRYMRKHLREVHSAVNGRICDICGRVYKSKSSLAEHKKHYHSGKEKVKKEKKTFECEVCGLQSATKYTLRDHMNTHTGTKFTCDLCGRGYASLKHLRRHKVKHLKESGELPESMTHRCMQCDKVFTQNHALKKHVEWVHGDKCHVCKVCGAKIKGSLIQHMETHSQVKKYCCHICGKKMRGKLKEHMLIHTGERPYACEFCGSTFKDKWYLRIHMRKHNGERPYTCTECGQSFAARSAFTLHLKKHSPDMIECEFCEEKFSSKLKMKEHVRKHFC